MGRPTVGKIAVRDVSAAAMLDLRAAEFRRLVAAGHLPKPVRLPGGIERWRVADIEAIVDGRAGLPSDAEDLEI